MAYYGSWKIDDLLTFYVNTQRFDTGVATDADSVPTYRVYEDETGTPLLTGSTALLDSANTAGFYSEQITLSAANGFEKGKSYSIYIAATVNSVAGAAHHNFQIEAEVDANTVSASNVSSNVVQWLGSAAATPTVAGVPEVDVTHWIGTAAATPTTGGVPEVDITYIAGAAVSTTTAQLGVNAVQISGDGPAADNAELFFDNTGFAASASSIGTASAIGVGGIASTAFAAGAIDAAAIAADAIGSSELAASAVDEILDDTIGDGTLTVRQALRVLVAGMAAKLSGAATTTITIRNVADTADVIVATVDANGNRTATTVTP